MLIATVNVNGLRASLRKGFEAWLTKRKPDIVCLQEVRAKPEDLGTWADGPAGWQVHWHPAERPGYAGVAILSRRKPDQVERNFGDPIFDTEGRWLAATFGKLTVVSLYLPSGSHDPARQKIKYHCMDLLRRKMQQLNQADQRIIIAGDYNIAHTKLDIRNWQANQKNSGFLPEEREWLSDLLEQDGWVDVFRQQHPRAEHYTWWSQRGGARGRNVGWRIDYQLATPAQAAKVTKVTIDKDPPLSDHAPMLVRYRA